MESFTRRVDHLSPCLSSFYTRNGRSVVVVAGEAIVHTRRGRRLLENNAALSRNRGPKNWTKESGTRVTSAAQLSSLLFITRDSRALLSLSRRFAKFLNANVKDSLKMKVASF